MAAEYRQVILPGGQFFYQRLSDGRSIPDVPGNPDYEALLIYLGNNGEVEVQDIAALVAAANTVIQAARNFLQNVDWAEELEDINQGITLVQNQIVNGSPTLAQVRSALGLLLIGNIATGGNEEGMIRKIHKIGRWIRSFAQILAVTDDTTTNGS